MGLIKLPPENVDKETWGGMLGITPEREKELHNTIRPLFENSDGEASMAPQLVQLGETPEEIAFVMYVAGKNVGRFLAESGQI